MQVHEPNVVESSIHLVYFNTSIEGPEVLRLEPNSDVTVAVNSQENVTFECAVDAGSSLLWQVNFVQLQCNSPTDRFITSHAENGIFRADTLDCNNSTLTVTPLWFSNPSNERTAIKCIAFNLAQATCSSEPPGNDFNHVIAFGKSIAAIVMFNLGPKSMLFVLVMLYYKGLFIVAIIPYFVCVYLWNVN